MGEARGFQGFVLGEGEIARGNFFGFFVSHEGAKARRKGGFLLRAFVTSCEIFSGLETLLTTDYTDKTDCTDKMPVYSSVIIRVIRG